MSIVIGTNLYSNVSYKLVGERQEDLVLTVQEKSNSAINVGLNFNSEDIVALLLNVILILGPLPFEVLRNREDRETYVWAGGLCDRA